MVPRMQPLNPVINKSIYTKFLWTGTSLRRNLITGSAANFVARSTRATTNGLSAYAPGGNSTLYVQWSDTNESPKFGAEPFIVFVSGFFSTSADIQVAFSNSNGGYQWRLQPGFNGTDIAGGAFGFVTYDGNSSNIGANGVITETFQTFVGVRIGTRHELWCNGALIASGTLTARNTDGYPITVGGWGATTYSYGDILLAGVITTNISSVLAKEISNDPFNVVFA